MLSVDNFKLLFTFWFNYCIFKLKKTTESTVTNASARPIPEYADMFVTIYRQYRRDMDYELR